MKSELQKRILSSIILIPLAIFFIIKGSYIFNLFLLLCLFISIYEWYLISKKKIYNIPGIIFLFFSFYTVYFLRNNFNEELAFFFLVLIICISTDIGGYVFGKMFKGPKLTKISPNKTYAGVIGSFIFSIISGTLYIQFQNIFTIFENIILKKNDLTYLLLILFISTVSQLGDLVVSYFKRLAKVKDTGKILPGHGGLLDRFDGIIFAIPVSYILFNLFIL